MQAGFHQNSCVIHKVAAPYGLSHTHDYMRTYPTMTLQFCQQMANYVARPCSENVDIQVNFGSGTEGKEQGTATSGYLHIATDIRKIRAVRLFWRSGRRDSNPRQPAWEAGTLPTELLPHQ